MKLSIQFISVAIVISGSLVSAGFHKHRAWSHHHHHRRALESLAQTVTVVQNVYMNDSPEPTPKPESPKADDVQPSQPSIPTTPCDEPDGKPTEQPSPYAEPSHTAVSVPHNQDRKSHV